MKLKNYIQLILVLVVFSTTDKAFSMMYETGKPNLSPISASDSSDPLTIYKKREKGLDVYTFTPDKIPNKETAEAIENRLKNVVDGFVSFTMNTKNEVKIVTDPSKITEKGLSLTLASIVKIHDYSPTNYEIIEL